MFVGARVCGRHQTVSCGSIFYMSEPVVCHAGCGKASRSRDALEEGLFLQALAHPRGPRQAKGLARKGFGFVPAQT